MGKECCLLMKDCGSVDGFQPTSEWKCCKGVKPIRRSVDKMRSFISCCCGSRSTRRGCRLALIRCEAVIFTTEWQLITISAIDEPDHDLGMVWLRCVGGRRKINDRPELERSLVSSTWIPPDRYPPWERQRTRVKNKKASQP